MTRSPQLPTLSEGVRAALEPVRMSEYGPVRCDEAQAVGYRVRAGQRLDADEADQALGALRSWLDQRLTMEEALAALSDLRRVCASGKDWVDTPDHFEAYARRCLTLPAAAVLRAIRDWSSHGERGRWMPQWQDLLRLIEREEDPVRRKLGALQRVAQGGQAEAAATGGIVTQLTPEQQAERKAHSARVMDEFRAKQATIPVEELLEPVLSKDQMARIKAGKAATKEKQDAEGSAALRRDIEARRPLTEPVENPVGEDQPKTAVNE